MNYFSHLASPFFEKPSFSAKGAAFNAKAWGIAQGLWFPRHQR